MKHHLSSLMAPVGQKRSLEVATQSISESLTQYDEQINRIKRRRRSMERMTQYPGVSQDGNDDSNSEEEEDLNAPAEAGVISKLDLKNFMCHDSFVLDFGPQINFIIGRNGSGKSAVLTGISVALGARATDTDRGNSLKGLIKHGKNVSRATVTLLNKGQQAFKHEEFGDKIIIERVLKVEGSHSISVKNSRGKTISTKKSTVDEILQFFSITIANPMTILTQTEAKNFLAHSSSTDKFNSFMTGTRLKEAYDNLKRTFSDAKEVSKALEEHEQIYNEVSKELEEAKEIVSRFSASKELERERELIVGKFNWFFHLCNRYRYDRCNELINEKKEQKKTKVESIADLKKVIENDSTELSDVNLIKLPKSEEDLKNVDLVINRHKVTMRSYKSDIDVLVKQIADVEENIQSCEKEITENDKLIKDEEFKLSKTNDGTTEKLEKFITERTTEHTALKEKMKDLINKVDDAKEEYDKVRTSLSKEYNECESNKRTAYEKLNSAQNQQARNDPVLLFSNANQKLIRDINSMKSMNKFKKEVRGPLGLHVKLNAQYKSAKTIIETMLARPLTTVLCEDYSDMRQLMNLHGKHGLQNQVILKQPETFDYSHEIPQTKYPSILDALNIDDPVIKCQLVDSHKLHRVLLIRSRKDAEQALIDDKQNLIASVICIVDGSGPVQMSKKNGSFQADPINSGRGEMECRLQILGESLSDSYQNEYDEAVTLSKEAKKKMDDGEFEVKKNMLSLMTEKDKVRKEWLDLGTAISKSQVKLDSLTNQDVKLEYLKDQKSILLSKSAKAKESLIPLKKEFDGKTETMKTEISLYNEIKTEYETKNNSYKELKHQVEQFESRIKHKTNDIKIIENELDAIDENIRKVSDAAPGFKEIADDREAKALKYCQLEETNLLSLNREKFFDKDEKRATEIQINNELERIESEIQHLEEQSGISRETAEINLLNVNDKMTQILKNRTDMNSIWKGLKSGLEERNDNLRQTTLSVFQEVENNFINALATRGFRGAIDFNIEKGTLTLMVATKEDSPLRVVESFSGGEKSYAQISFLFAIWGPMHSRIRGLDEFDVFMDQINRRIALKLILDKVKQNSKRQTIFITPLSVSGVEGLNDISVHIHEISPPERQTI